MSAVRAPLPASLLSVAERETLANKHGPRRTVFFTKKLPEKKSASSKDYARTGQYLGDWKDNKWHGKGTFEQANGSRYVGEWVEGKRSGMGTLWVKVNGELRKRYSGMWLNDLPHGRGVQYYACGDVYNGEWKSGVRHGVGILQCADRGMYEGGWFNNRKHGFGVFDYASGDHFEGMWVEDKKEGEGVHFYFDATKKCHTKRYDGEWVDDSPKCGYYTEMPPDDLVPASMLPEPLPVVEVIDPEDIMEQRLLQIRDERAHVRAQRVPIDEHFTPEELQALQVAFSRVDVTDSGSIPVSELPQAFQQVGMELSEEELQQVLVHLNKSDSPTTTFSFAEFSQAADFLSPLDGVDEEVAEEFTQ